MNQRIVVIGAGISGVMTAYMLHYFDPKSELTIIDAGPEPILTSGGDQIESHYGATLGQGRDARHFTGTEGLSFQNPIHTKLFFELANENSPGWQTIAENELTSREKLWRKECIDRYKRDVSPEYNPYDYMYTTLNYGGMATWEWLSKLNPELTRFCINNDHIYVAFNDDKSLEDDFNTETKFNPFQEYNPVVLSDLKELYPKSAEVIATKKIASQLLRLPGATWRIQSLWQYLYQSLIKANIQFVWNSSIQHTESLPEAEVYIWAVGTGYALPDIYNDYGRVQGIGGWWLTIPNHGFKAPFKFSAPQPSGYINFTPDGKFVHISGGFGWVGEREYKEAKLLLEPSRKHFLKHIGDLLKVSEKQLKVTWLDVVFVQPHQLAYPI